MAANKSQEASSSTSRCAYQVFLSFKGKDTRKTFTDHLYTVLNDAGFRTFVDDDGIGRGEDIKSEQEKAIQESRMSIIVLSKNYASSTRCLEELVMILKRKTCGHVVLPVFYDVDPSEVRKQIGSFKDAFMRREQEIEMETETSGRRQELKGKVEEWRAALKEVADLAGMNLQNQADGHESRFIRKIIKVVGDKLSRTVLDIAPYPIGIFSRAKNIQHWIQDESIDIGIALICGMGGIGKTTMAKLLYNLNFLRFDGSSFIANVREISKPQDGFLRLQRQLLSDILRGRKVKINNVDEGIVAIKDAICCKRVLVILDDVDNPDQLDAVLGMRDWLFPGSRIIITTRRERLLRANEVSRVQWVEKLGYDESLELFSWHAFGQSYPIDGYVELSESVVHRCDGLPLAIKVLGSALSGRGLDEWKSQIRKLQAIPNSDILEKLRISYDSLQDEHDKSLFLYLTCFFVGKDKDCTITVLDRCEFYTLVGIQNLIDRCLVTIDEHNMLAIHQSLQDMGREIIRQESPKEPGERSILCNHNDSFNVLRENTGTIKIEGLILDMYILMEDQSVRTVFDVNRKRRFEEFLDKPFLSNLGNSLKRHCFSIFSSQMVDIVSDNSNQGALEVDAFARMRKLKILHLNQVQVSGPSRNFPKGLRWLSWGRFPHKSIPPDFPLESVVALDMQYSRLKNVWKGTKFLALLKILNLSHSRSLAKTPNFLGLPNLERLMLENCPSLVEVDESLVQLERLVLLNVKDCTNLRRLPRRMSMLKLLEKLDISGCSNLEKLPTEMTNMESLTVLHANATPINHLLSSPGEEKAMKSVIRPWLWKPTKSPVTSWASLPRSLVELSITHCNLAEDAFPTDISSLSSLSFLDLSHNPIRCLPDCIKDLNGLQRLYVTSCYSLQTLVVPKHLEELLIGSNDSLEKVTFSSRSHRPKLIRYTDKCDNLVELMPYIKVEPIGNVDAEILNHVGLSNLESIRNQIVELDISAAGVTRKLPLQGCHELHIFSCFLPGRKVPPFFNFMNTGSSISFVVPPQLNSRIRGLSVCSLYCLRDQDQHSLLDYASRDVESHIIVSNTTKGLIWSYWPNVLGNLHVGEDMIWLSYWKFENGQLEGGDELNFTVTGERLFKEVGVHVVYEEEQEKKSTKVQSTSEEEICRSQISPYGQVVPGNVPADPMHKPKIIPTWSSPRDGLQVLSSSMPCALDLLMLLIVIRRRSIRPA